MESAPTRAIELDSHETTHTSYNSAWNCPGRAQPSLITMQQPQNQTNHMESTIEPNSSETEQISTQLAQILQNRIIFEKGARPGSAHLPSTSEHLRAPHRAPPSTAPSTSEHLRAPPRNKAIGTISTASDWKFKIQRRNTTFFLNSGTLRRND